LEKKGTLKKGDRLLFSEKKGTGYFFKYVDLINKTPAKYMKK